MSGTPAPAPGPAAAATPAPAAAAASPAPAPTPATTSTATSTKSTSKGSKSASKASGAGTQSKSKSKPRRKKPAAKSSGAASAQAIMNAARAAQNDLATLKAQAAARLSDPLWYRVEDVVPAVAEDTPMMPSSSSSSPQSSTVLPEQLQIVEAALSHNHMTRADVTPQAFACLLEQARRFALELLADAQDYALVAGRQDITRADLLLASEMRPDHPTAVTTQLPKLNLLSKEINRVPLPPIPSQCYSGILLPPKQHQLTARTFDVISSAQVAQKMVSTVPAAPKPSSSKNRPSYGAIRGRQVAVHLKDKQQEDPTPMDTTPSGGGPSQIPVPTATTTQPPAGAAPVPSAAGVPAPPTGS